MDIDDEEPRGGEVEWLGSRVRVWVERILGVGDGRLSESCQ